MYFLQTFVIFCLAPTKPRVTPSDKMSEVDVYAVAGFIITSMVVILLFLGKYQSYCILFSNFLACMDKKIVILFLYSIDIPVSDAFINTCIYWKLNVKTKKLMLHDFAFLFW